MKQVFRLPRVSLLRSVPHRSYVPQRRIHSSFCKYSSLRKFSFQSSNLGLLSATWNINNRFFTKESQGEEEQKEIQRRNEIPLRPGDYHLFEEDKRKIMIDGFNNNGFIVNRFVFSQDLNAASISLDQLLLFQLEFFHGNV